MGATDRPPTEQFAKPFTSAQPPMSPAAVTSPHAAPVIAPTDPTPAPPVPHTGSGASFAAPNPSAPTPPPMPLGLPATPPPAGAPPPPANAVPVNTPSARADGASAGVAPVPVSASRRERDAALSASTPNANAILTRARRIAAALNIGAQAYGFFWVTGLTADGSIVVANSFGLGYIPDGVELPPQVTMASADESIPPAVRGTWATYPILALQGWAQAHDRKLRAVIATAEQFASFDPGVPRVVLQREDIPETGRMQGRNRLEVIAPEVAARLNATADGNLQDLLPAAPTDATAPEDRSAALWFELTKPLMSTAATRGVSHLEAFITYADHAQELALHRAHTAVDAAAQRAAIADWIYWQHLGVLMSDAIAVNTTV